MLRHIVTWNFADGFSDEEKFQHAKKIKHDLEALINLDGVVKMQVFINELATSNMDILLDSAFENEAALAAYKIHPQHVKVAEFIGAVLKNRACFDYYS